MNRPTSPALKRKKKMSSEDDKCITGVIHVAANQFQNLLIKDGAHYELRARIIDDKLLIEIEVDATVVKPLPQDPKQSS